MSPAADTGLAADGNPLADGGPQGDIIVHPARGRIDLTISADGPLQPGVAVELTIEGVAREAIDSGEVVLTLPTKAMMEHVGPGRPELPVEASGVLASMAAGDMWNTTFTVPGAAAGYYQVAVAAHTHGPDGGPWLFDATRSTAWMYVSGTGGQLTRFFEDSLFPEGVRPMPGPVTEDGAPYSRPDTTWTGWHPDSVYLDMVYPLYSFVRQREVLYSAVGAEIFGGYGDDGRDARRVIVPEDGIVSFACPEDDEEVWGDGWVPHTALVEGHRQVIRSWSANSSHCGRRIFVVVRNTYTAWRFLNLAADTLQKHFWHTRGQISWEIGTRSTSFYRPGEDRIYLGRDLYTLRALWGAAHEYGHSLHYKALGGWDGEVCDPHYFDSISSYECALLEGFADYAGTVGSVTADDPNGHLGDCFEHFGTPKPQERWCRDVSHDRKPEIEGWVAALFMDLIDDNGNYEKGDETELGGHFVAKVFRTCEVRGKWLGIVPNWRDRNKVSDIVWCLENYIHEPTHTEVFPNTGVPEDVRREPERDPPGWDPFDIRRTWLKNLK